MNLSDAHTPNAQSPSDEELMLATRDGDREAFAVLVQRYQHPAWRLAWRHVRDEQRAQDMVQEAFLKVFRSASQYRPTARFSTFFYRVLVNVCLDSGRRRFEESTDDVDRLDPATQGDALEQRRRDAEVQRALARLPDRHRMAVLLKHFEGLSHEAIAEAMDASPKAVERLLAKARRRLAAELFGKV